MSIRNLDKLFNPRSVALIGATPRPGSVGAFVARNMRRAGFTGELMLVNPHHQAIDGLTVHPNIASLPQAPDLAVIVTPPETMPSLTGELGERGTRAAVIITAGFGELGKGGHELQQATLDAAKPICCASWARTASASWSPRLASMPLFLTWRHRPERSRFSANRVR
jgi:acetyltransferase